MRDGAHRRAAAPPPFPRSAAAIAADGWFGAALPVPLADACRDGQQSWTCVIPVSERSFADRSGLVEIHVTRATSGEDLRRQLDGVRRQVRINAAAIEVGGELHLQAALF